MNKPTRLAGLATAGIAIAAAAVVTMSTASASPTAPATQGDGSYLVGQAFKPGVYTAPGVGYCMWQRYELAASGKLIQVQEGRQPWVEIRKTDAMFTTWNCGDWTRSGETGGLGSLGALDFGSLGPVGSSDDAPQSPPPWTPPRTNEQQLPPYTTTPTTTAYVTPTCCWTTTEYPTYDPDAPVGTTGEPGAN
ncbi:hypothetical protein [Rhodococcus tukisamuensis]|uniref:Secreted protein n=1 Tax=Rhodococcus tukisamuensis TaxID=168276 RepID=A0A1G7D1H7_9NOCA|nr:hypothetical protein [Rhodococcus tukisamuensis]SDE44585.1 hypothetical protein SAMN05444580_11778 [Rhodococcus tukisamuensis]